MTDDDDIATQRMPLTPASQSDLDDVELLHEPALDKASIRRIILKEWFVRAFLARDGNDSFTYNNFMRLVTVEACPDGKDFKIEIGTTGDATLCNKLLIWFREPAARRPFNMCIIEDDTVIFEGNKECVNRILNHFFWPLGEGHGHLIM